MNWLTNEVLFYGGIVIAAGSLAAALFYFFITQIKKVRLEAKLDMEYGEKDG